MAICALGYIGIRSDRMDDWSEFASKLIGMQQVDRAGQTCVFRMDAGVTICVTAGSLANSFTFTILMVIESNCFTIPN